MISKLSLHLFYSVVLWCILCTFFNFHCNALDTQQLGFKLHASITGVSDKLANIIGPGPKRDTQWLYASHNYGNNALDILAIDPLSGQTEIFTSPLNKESGAWAMILGPDNQIYIGTSPTAHIMQLDWKTRNLIDLGRPAITEQNIWCMALGQDKNIYGGTSPNAKLIRFNPATGRSDDLGRMSETQNYGLRIAADNKGFVYMGIGLEKRDLVAYEIATKQYRSILSKNLEGPGYVDLVRGADGNVYAKLDNIEGEWLKLDGFNFMPRIVNSIPAVHPLTLTDGRRVTYDGRSVSIQNKDGKTIQSETGYRGKSMKVFRIGLGPDNRLYGSTAQPGHFFWVSTERDEWGEIANAGKGEINSFLAWNGKLIIAAYGFPAPVMIYKPGYSWNPGLTPNDNPWQIHYENENIHWRPLSMIAGPKDKIFIGALPGYGFLGGPLCIFDPITGKLDQYYHVIQDQSVVALAVTQSGVIVGGTTIEGGSGSHPTQRDAKIFLWDPIKRKKIFETVAVSGSGSIKALAVGKNGLVYGFTENDFMFIFDPQGRKIISAKSCGIRRVIYNALGRGYDGKLYGLHAEGIFTINENEHNVKNIVTYPPGITGGFAIWEKRIYFTSGPQILSFKLP